MMVLKEELVEMLSGKHLRQIILGRFTKTCLMTHQGYQNANNQNKSCCQKNHCHSFTDFLRKILFEDEL